MYQGFAIYKNWDFNLLNYTSAEYGEYVYFLQIVVQATTLCVNLWFKRRCTICLFSGGLHHAAIRIAGESVYRHLKHEGGTHRVQRIPEVGLSSRMQRIHTGTMTVIVLPQPKDVTDVLCVMIPILSAHVTHLSLVAKHPCRPEGSASRHLQISRSWRAKRQHDGQRCANCSSSNW